MLHHHIIYIEIDFRFKTVSILTFTFTLQVLASVLVHQLGLVRRATLITVKIEILEDHQVRIPTVVRWAGTRVWQLHAPRQ